MNFSGGSKRSLRVRQFRRTTSHQTTHDRKRKLFCNADENDVNRDVFVGFPEHKAWILQSPLDVWNDKMSLGRCGCAFKMDKDGEVISCGVPRSVKIPVTWMVESPDGAMTPV